MRSLALHWFRNDLRLRDNPALSCTASLHHPVVGLYILEEENKSAQNVWLHASLQALESSLHQLKIPLIFSKGHALEVWKKLIQAYPIEQVSWNRCFEPSGLQRDQQIEKLLKEHGIAVAKANGTHLMEPTALSTKSGDFYKVFTPYWNMHQKMYEPAPATAKIKPNASFPRVSSLKLSALQLAKDPLITLEKAWEPGEKGAFAKARHFSHHGLSSYSKQRDFPAYAAHSSLSPHLHFGEISPHALVRICKNTAFIRELVFRDFAMQLLYHIPTLDKEPMKPEFSSWRWENKPAFFEAWKKGMTGYPLVDAGMRQLRQTGFMHNRVRMVVASFLVKDLHIAWQKGAAWFWRRLLDADLASNSFNWQWCAGTGPDAQPFFRIFNPVLQSKKFDPEGIYIRRWVPELDSLSSQDIHTPWKASTSVFQATGYPFPIVDHAAAKKATLQEFHRVSLRSAKKKNASRIRKNLG